MILNLVLASVLVATISASYGGSNNVFSYNNNHGIQHHGRRNPHHGSSSSSSESDEDRTCSRLQVFSSTIPAFSSQLVAPRIAYYTNQGKSKAIVVCDGPLVQTLIGYAPGNNPQASGELQNIAILSFSTTAALTLECDRRNNGYEAFDLITQKQTSIKKVACLETTEDIREYLLTFVVN